MASIEFTHELYMDVILSFPEETSDDDIFNNGNFIVKNIFIGEDNGVKLKMVIGRMHYYGFSVDGGGFYVPSIQAYFSKAELDNCNANVFVTKKDNIRRIN